MITKRPNNGSLAAAIAASFALPSDYPPYRMRDEYSTEETALFKVFEEHPITCGVTGGTNPLLRTDTHVEFIFQDLLCNRIFYNRNLLGQQWIYTWAFGRDTGGNNLFSFTLQAGASDTLYPSHAISTGTFKAHGDVYFARNDNGIAGFWIDSPPVAGASTITVTINVAPAAAQGNIILLLWTNGVWKETQKQTAAVGTLIYTFTLTGGTSGYYAIAMNNFQAGQSVIVTHQGISDVWSHQPAPYIMANANSIESCRTLGHSILVKNVTANQNKQGAITAVQPGKSRYWYSFASSNGTDDVYGAVRDYAGAANSKPLETGLYGFVKPTEQEDLRLREPFTVTNVPSSTNTVWTFAQTPILGTTYVVVAMQCNVGTPQNLLVRTDLQGEYETGNQFFNVAKPAAEPEMWRDGMEALASFVQFYENPTHWKKILQTLGTIASVGGRITSLFGPKGAAIGVPLSMAGDIIRGGFQ